MSPSLHLRLMTPADLPFADSVRALAGWNQTPEDWRRFLAMEPGGCFIAEWNGAPAGAATTTVYGPQLAWIGMVLVHPEFRRRGLGRALLEHCITSLQERRIACIKLDATPLGKTLYDRLGFQDEWTLTRWSATGIQVPAREMDPGVRPWREEDAGLIDSLDAAAFGVSRQRLLRMLVAQSCDALALESPPGKMAAYGLLRPGARALYLGPAVAASPAEALRLLPALLARRPGQTIYWDIPDQQTALIEWARQRGFTPQRPLIRMFLGENSHPGLPSHQAALAGPEVG